MASTNTTLSAINRGGIATLANGTCWHIPSFRAVESEKWRIGAEVAIQGHKRRTSKPGCNLTSSPSHSPPSA
jgi:hypothetical protein